MMKNETPTVFEFQADGDLCRLVCLNAMDAFESIRTDWKNLEAKSKDPFVYFQSYDWCFRWAKHYVHPTADGKGPKLRLYCLYRDDALVMVWPMMVDEISFGIKVLTFLTEPLGQYGNVLCDEAAVTVEMVKTVWDQLRSASGIDALTINHFPAEGLLAEAIGTGGYFNKTPIHASMLDLKNMPEWEAYLASLKKSVRKRRNARRNKIAKLGKVDFEVHFGGTKRYRELIDEALDMKMRWLEETGRISIGLSTDTARAFLRDLEGTNSNAAKGRPEGAVVQVLTLDGNSIGIEIGRCLNDHYCSYLGAFDLDYQAYSPGKIQMEMTQQWAKETGFENIDFLGDPAEYKSNWTDQQVELACNSVPLSAKGFFYCVVWKLHLRPWLKELHGAMGADWRKKLMGALGNSKPASTSSKKVPVNKPSVADISTKGI